MPARSRAPAAGLAARSILGEVEIEVAFRRELTQQQGLLHAGVTTTAVDTACGYAALSLMPPTAAVRGAGTSATFVAVL